ncbi:MAG: hypothetical protein ACE361_25515 [Aureliella sp.]
MSKNANQDWGEQEKHDLRDAQRQRPMNLAFEAYPTASVSRTDDVALRVDERADCPTDADFDGANGASVSTWKTRHELLDFAVKSNEFGN